MVGPPGLFLSVNHKKEYNTGQILLTSCADNVHNTHQAESPKSCLSRKWPHLSHTRFHNYSLAASLQISSATEVVLWHSPSIAYSCNVKILWPLLLYNRKNPPGSCLTIINADSELRHTKRETCTSGSNLHMCTWKGRCAQSFLGFISWFPAWYTQNKCALVPRCSCRSDAVPTIPPSVYSFAGIQEV